VRAPFALILMAALAALPLACDKKTPTASSTSSSRTLRVALVPKGTAHDYWKSVHAGGIKAEKELSTASEKIEVVFRGPEREDDRDQQISLVQNLVSAKYDAIVLAPLDNAALVTPVKAAKEAGIPVVVIDSGLNGEGGRDFVSFVATDNRKGGAMGGKHLGDLLGGKGKVLILRYLEGSASTHEREEGFVEAIAKFPDIKVIDPRRYAGATRATAQEAAENLLATNADITGVFCPNESSTFGMLLALRSKSMAGKVRFVGFDASDAAVAALSTKEVDGLVLQDPVRMGYLGVKTAVEKLRGVTPPASIDTGVVLVTPANMSEPAMKQLLSPDLTGMLGGR
jgi:ribose transport system substrate-binding protein